MPASGRAREMSVKATIIACVVFILAVPFSMVGQGGGSTDVPVLPAGIVIPCSRFDESVG